MPTVHSLLAMLPTAWVENYVATFEDGRVQKHPHARFVNAAGECCIVGALAGARSSADMRGSAIWAVFAGNPLEELSRRFEARRLSGQEVYEEALLVLAARRAEATATAALAV